MALATDLISYYKLDETSGTTADDAHGSNDGTNSGATVNQTGKIGKAYSFDGVNDEIDCGTATDTAMGSSDFSVSFWLNLDNTTQDNKGIISRGVYADDGWLVRHWAGGDIEFALSQNGKRQKFKADEVLTTSWQHITITRSGATSTLYIDGTSTAWNAWDGTGEHNNLTGTDPTNNAARHLFIVHPSDSGSGIIAGKIDEVGIWSRALTSTEVSELYNSGDGLAYPFSTTLSFTKTGNARIQVQNSLTKNATASIEVGGIQFTKEAISSIEIEDNQFTKTATASIYIGTISGQVTNQSVPVVGAKISVMQSDDDDMTNMELVSVETSDGSGNWSAHIDQGKVGWASAYYKDGTDLYRSKAHGYLEVV